MLVMEVTEYIVLHDEIVVTYVEICVYIDLLLIEHLLLYHKYVRYKMVYREWRLLLCGKTT